MARGGGPGDRASSGGHLLPDGSRPVYWTAWYAGRESPRVSGAAGRLTPPCRGRGILVVVPDVFTSRRGDSGNHSPLGAVRRGIPPCCAGGSE